MGRTNQIKNGGRNMKICIACGMPMADLSDHAMGDAGKDYCKHCSRPDGTMQTYQEKLESLTGFIVRTQGLEAEAAKNLAKTMMSHLPAWKS